MSDEIAAFATALDMTYEALSKPAEPKPDPVKEEAKRVTRHYKFFPECNRDGLD